MNVAAAREALAKAEEELSRCTARSEAVTPGGLHGDPATLSGVRRKANHRMDLQRYGSYVAEACAARKVADARRTLELAEWQERRAAADAAAHRDIDSLKPGDFVRTKTGWRKVVRVNRVSVSVETDWSWTDTVRFEKIIETKAASRE